MTNAEFLVNVNTSAHNSRPYYSHATFGPQNDDKLIYLALRTANTVAILTITNKVELKYQLELADNFTRKHSITTFEFVCKPIANENERLLLIGFRTGLILEIDFLTTKFIDYFNVMDEKGKEPWKKSVVQKLCIIPFKQQFLALFQDQTLIKYSSKGSKSNIPLLEEIQKLEEKISLKTLNKYPNQRKKVETYELGCINDNSLFSCYAVFSLEEYKDPQAYFKFFCSPISDIVVLPPEHFTYKLCNQDANFEPLIIAYSSLDGYLRITDLHNLVPIFAFKSNYGGINSLAFENETSTLVALACQDDSTIVLNVETKKYVRISGQASFISRSIFHEVDEKIIRIISASYDGSVCVTEFERDLMDGDSITEKDLPVIFKYNKKDAHQIENTDCTFVNGEGLGFCEGIHHVFLTCAFDGCTSIWMIKNQEEQQQQDSPQKQASLQQQQQQQQPIQQYGLVSQSQQTINQNQQNYNRNDEKRGQDYRYSNKR